MATKYYFLGGARVAMRSDGTLYYPLTDHLGSTTVTMDSLGNVVSELRYKPFGETRLASGTTPTDYRFTGQFSNESDFGLYFYNARWCDAYLNHFTQPDSIIPDPYNSADFDKYSYARNNPIKYTDPSGHRVTSGCGDDGRESCGATEREKAQAEYQRQRNDALKCQAGNKTYCSYAENHPVETVVSGVGAITGAAAAEAFVLGGGAASAIDAVTLACLRNPICAAGIGAGTAGATATTSSTSNTIGSTGDIGENWLAQSGGASQVSVSTSQGPRYVDQIINGMAYESKVGYVSLTQNVSLQVAKDVELLQIGRVTSVSWVFFPSPITGNYGPSTPLYNLLVNNGIQVFFVRP